MFFVELEEYEQSSSCSVRFGFFESSKDVLSGQLRVSIIREEWNGSWNDVGRNFRKENERIKAKGGLQSARDSLQLEQHR